MPQTDSAITILGLCQFTTQHTQPIPSKKEGCFAPPVKRVGEEAEEKEKRKKKEEGGGGGGGGGAGVMCAERKKEKNKKLKKKITKKKKKLEWKGSCASLLHPESNLAAVCLLP